MRIAVIGTGNVGGAFTRAATKAGQTVTVTGTSAEKAGELAAQTGAASVEGNVTAVQGADLVVLAVPGSAAAGRTNEEDPWRNQTNKQGYFMDGLLSGPASSSWQ